MGDFTWYSLAYIYVPLCTLLSMMNQWESRIDYPCKNSLFLVSSITAASVVRWSAVTVLPGASICHCNLPNHYGSVTTVTCPVKSPRGRTRSWHQRRRKSRRVSERILPYISCGWLWVTCENLDREVQDCQYWHPERVRGAKGKIFLNHTYD